MKKIRTAAYCRVSTKKEEQEGSYELQERYFTALICANPEMEMVGIYGDKGKTGLYIKKRPGLQKLLDDSKKGCIDLILTKSISRFARNMSECAGMIRELRIAGVNIQFEKENLNSLDTKCDLLLNIISAIAQEESNSISRHSVASHNQYAREGRPFGRTAFGYRNAGNNVWKIDENDAAKVRTAFEMAAEGRTYKEIITALNVNETDGYIWKTTRLKSILTNPVYLGDYYSHKKVCLVPGKAVVNKNYRDSYYIKGHHEAIVSTDLYNAVQKILKRNLLNSHKKRSEDDIMFLKGARENGCNEN